MKAIILGLPRSGTTLLGRILSGVDGFWYEEEPNVIWRYRNYAALGHDEFSERHATDEVVQYIRNYFDRRAQHAAASALVEKTPANVLRPEFVLKVMPEARIIVVERNLDDIRASLYRRIVHGEDRNADRFDEVKHCRYLRLKARRLFKVPLRDLPAYGPQIACDLTSGLLFPRHRFWGPRQKDWEATLDLPVRERINRQCAAMVRSLNSFLARREGQLLRIGYEGLRADPDRVLGEIEGYLDLPKGRLDRALVQ